MTEEMVKVDVVAKVLNASRATVYVMVKKGEIRSHKIRGGRRFLLSEVLADVGVSKKEG